MIYFDVKIRTSVVDSVRRLGFVFCRGAASSRPTEDNREIPIRPKIGSSDDVKWHFVVSSQFFREIGVI